MDESKLFEIFKLSDEELDKLINGLDEQEKEELIKFLIMFSKKMNQLYISYIKAQDTVIRTQDISIKQSDLTIDDLLNRLNKSTLKVYKKNDIMELLGCESDKALRFLKLTQQTGHSIKIGKEYQITKQNLEKFMKEYEGKDLFI